MGRKGGVKTISEQKNRINSLNKLFTGIIHLASITIYPFYPPSTLNYNKFFYYNLASCLLIYNSLFIQKTKLMLCNLPWDLDVHTWTSPKDSFFLRNSFLF